MSEIFPSGQIFTLSGFSASSWSSTKGSGSYSTTDEAQGFFRDVTISRHYGRHWFSEEAHGIVEDVALLLA